MSDPPSAAERLRSFWNERYAGAAYAYGTEPNDFLVETLARFGPLPAGAPVLCLADGEGRNGVWLALQGLDVTSLDIADEGLRKAGELAARAGVALHTVHADATAADLGPRPWVGIFSIFLHLPAAPRRALHRRCLAALAPGGLFVFEAYGPGQLALGTGGPKEPALLPALAEVEADFAGEPGATIVHRHAGRRAVREGRLHTGVGEVVQLVVRKEAA